MMMREPEIICGSPSPNGTMEAFVEQDSQVAWFYLIDRTDDARSQVNSCWVRNLSKAPAGIDRRRLQRGDAPLLPVSHCRHACGAPPLAEKDLEIVWFEEGNAAALLCQDEVLAIIPEWSGREGFSGYARDCTEESELAWPLSKGNALLRRVPVARRFWQAWDSHPSPWERLEKKLLCAYERQWGRRVNYYQLARDGWPPSSIVRVSHEGGSVLATLGTSLRPQPQTQADTPEIRRFRRIEIAIAVSQDVDAAAQRALLGILGGLNGYAWRYNTRLGDGHTLAAEELPLCTDGLPLSSVLLLEDPLGRPALDLPQVFDEPVRLLWLVPITAAERNLAVREGSEVLRSRLQQAGVGWIFTPRSSLQD